MKTEVFGLGGFNAGAQDGNVKESIEHTLEEAKIEAILGVKYRTKYTILNTYSVEQQVSAAAGHYDAEKNATINNFVKAQLDACDIDEAAINACSTISEISSLGY